MQHQPKNKDMGYSSHLITIFIMLIAAQMATCRGGSQFVTWHDFRIDDWSGNPNSNDGSRAHVIFVSKDGRGDSKTVQGAVDLVPHGNKERVKIVIFPGVYREKVTIPNSKPYISFIGKGGSETKISWHLKASDKDTDGQVVGTYDSASVAVDADYFCANAITFENTAPSAQAGATGMQAVALRLSGDKAMLFSCKILGSQDTLFDNNGRHYFLNCYIQGSIDFIFGSARSLYQGCELHAVAAGYGAIAASQRNSASDDSGFSFVNCRLKGTGMLYLGRAWGRYARVVYSYCKFESTIVPEGWSDWGDRSRRRTVWFGEYKCSGGGAESNTRAQWARSLNYEEAKPFLDPYYIDGHEWLSL